MSTSPESALNRLASSGSVQPQPRLLGGGRKGGNKSIGNLLWKACRPYAKWGSPIGGIVVYYFPTISLFLCGGLVGLVLLAGGLLFYTPLGDYLHQSTSNCDRRLPEASTKSPKTGASSLVSPGFVNAEKYFDQFHGHPVDDLGRIHDALSGRTTGAKTHAQAQVVEEFVWLAGDSSLDNKHWIKSSKAPAVNGYEGVLQPPMAVQDVNYWLNKYLEDLRTWSSSRHSSESCPRLPKTACMMTAVEATTVADRKYRLLLQDRIIQTRMQDGGKDTLLVSVGGNDVALQPSAMTALSMVSLVYSPKWLISSGYAPGLRHVKRILRDEVDNYVVKLLSSSSNSPQITKIPKKVLLCMIYYPDETPSGSWADRTLELLGYNQDPTKLQFLINSIYDQIGGPTAYNLPYLPRGVVVPVTRIALHRHGMDGSQSGDYVARVEPSVQGGDKMARAFMSYLYPAEWAEYTRADELNRGGRK